MVSPEALTTFKHAVANNTKLLLEFATDDGAEVYVSLRLHGEVQWKRRLGVRVR